MRRAIAICLLVAAVWCGGPAWADDAAEVSAADHQKIEQTIEAQIEAFRRDAGAAAFSYASPNIRSIFGNATNFMAMVRQEYPPVYRPRSFAFDRLVTIDDRIVQRVRIVGPDGVPVLALYTMEQQPDGTWRIDGCALTRPDDLTT